ncbi:MAG: PSD1 and planctomycete cytochrome C domain-containing protein [Planctomycetota bacterium]|nr:PSD1 and planctomycete cytochrome C domain-containing protein [Planctomycetota bacterium]
MSDISAVEVKMGSSWNENRISLFTMVCVHPGTVLGCSSKDNLLSNDMVQRITFSLATIVLVGLPAAAEVAFNRDIRPILSEKCFACHGVDAKERKADLRLDVPAAAFGKGKSGKLAIVQGKPEESEMWRRIISPDEDDRMPPAETKKPLTADERETLRRWIAEGAPYQKHWAFEPPVAKSLPADGREIDHFIDAKLRELGLTANPKADLNTLIRRVAFATTGLPPTLEELDDFLGDSKPGAYERMVDRYLASNHYGEEMARHWLDVARYADTHGMHLDNERQMYAYRDWVVGAFNRNLPFDRFTVQQIAGDLLPEPGNDQLVATGFNRCNVTTGEGGTIAEEFIFRYAVERASTTAQTWLGLSAGCAVCHDHKFDPITTKDFYSFYAFFHSNADPALDGNSLLTNPVLKVKPEGYDAQLETFTKRIAEIEAKMDVIAADVVYEDPGKKDPPPPVELTERVWFEDAFPTGAKVSSSGHALTYAEAPDPIFSGKHSLKRSGPGLAQDYYYGGAAPLVVPPGATFFVHVYIDPATPAKEIMIQFHTTGWNHRAKWGADLILWGKEGTGERYDAGPLPKAGEWVRLEVAADKMNLAAGIKVLGYAFTVQDGTVYFDKMGVASLVDPANDSAQSFAAWRKAAAGKDTPGAPEDLNAWLKEGPDKVRTPEELQRLKAYYLRAVCTTTEPQFAEHAAAVAALVKERDAYEAAFPSTFVWRDLPNPRQSFVMVRGQYDKPGEKVEPGTPALLPPLNKADPDGRATRLDLANWLVSRENPLTARVTVNRFWQQLFGVGLVKTSHDLGTQGEVPSHPELLDWLAVRFQDEGWDVKKLMRRMLTSDAFRRACFMPELWRSDPDNRYLARGPRLRLDAEQLRDAALFAGGLLKMKMGGKGVRTYQPPNIWEPVGFRGSNTANYQRDNGDALYRRSLYTFLKRTAPAPFMANFDAPNRESSCFRRERSNTPLQALQLMNDVQYFEAARGLATRMMGASAEPAGKVTFAYRTVLSRVPATEEATLVETFYREKLARYREVPAEAAAAIGFGDSKPPKELDVPELAAWTLVANLILNLDESIVRN